MKSALERYPTRFIILKSFFQYWNSILKILNWRLLWTKHLQLKSLCEMLPNDTSHVVSLLENQNWNSRFTFSMLLKMSGMPAWSFLASSPSEVSQPSNGGSVERWLTGRGERLARARGHKPSRGGDKQAGDCKEAFLKSRVGETSYEHGVWTDGCFVTRRTVWCLISHRCETSNWFYQWLKKTILIRVIMNPE